MDYQLLTTEDQTKILQQRLGEYEQGHYNFVANLEVLASSPVADQESTQNNIAAIQQNMALLDHAHAKTLKMIQELGS